MSSIDNGGDAVEMDSAPISVAAVNGDGPVRPAGPGITELDLAETEGALAADNPDGAAHLLVEAEPASSEDTTQLLEVPEEPEETAELAASSEDTTQLLEAPGETAELRESGEEETQLLESREEATELLESPEEATELLESREEATELLESRRDRRASGVARRSGRARRGA